MIKLFYKFIHSTYKAFSIFLFLLVFFIGNKIEGPSTANCADGSYSSAIGRRGACSHHGGVVYNRTGFLSLITALASGIGSYYFFSNKFKEKYGYIVISNLPEHEFESRINSYKIETVYKQITKFKTARQLWNCKICKAIISPKETYAWKYASRDSFKKEIRFCLSCADKSNKENTEKDARNETKQRLISDTHIIIAEYYRINSIAKKY